MNYNSSCVKDPQLEHTFLNFFVEYIWVIIKKWSNPERQNEKKYLSIFFSFLMRLFY